MGDDSWRGQTFQQGVKKTSAKPSLMWISGSHTVDPQAAALRIVMPNAPERQRRANVALVARVLAYRAEHPEATWADTGAVIGEHPERLKRLCRRYRPTE